MIVVGIDPGVRTGLAVWDTSSRQLLDVRCSGIIDAMRYLRELQETRGIGLVVFEDARKRKWIPRERAFCANDGLPKNALSFLVSRALQSLPRPMCVVSYADSGMNHHGYIYQATNWIYTGLSSPHIEYEVKGMENKHSRHINDILGEWKPIEEIKAILGDKIVAKERSRKHRYFYFLGSRTDRRIMRQLLKYPVCEYPKGDNIRYDASYKVHSNYILF